MRRLRRTKALRELVRETDLSARHLVQPLFVVSGEGVREEVPSMPGIDRLSISELVAEATAALRLEATVEHLIRTIHAHPTFAEAIGEAAHAVHGAAIHL